MTVRHPEKVNNIEHPIQKKPAWIRVKASYSKEYTETKNILKKKPYIEEQKWHTFIKLVFLQVTLLI